MRIRFAAIAGVVGLGFCVSAADAAPTGTEAPIVEQSDLTGTPVTVGETAYGKFLASRHAESVGDFAAAASFAAHVLAEQPELKNVVQRGHLLMASAGRSGVRRTTVWMLEDDVPIPRSIQVGLSDEQATEVVRGLDEGDTVIVRAVRTKDG